MRCLVTIAAAAALSFALLCAPAGAAVEPIIGTWQFDGAVVKVTGGAGSYQGVVQSGKYGGCSEVVHPGYVAWKSVKGSGLSYSGKLSWYRTDNCSPIGEAPMTITLSDASTGVAKGSSPDGTVSFSTPITRIGSAPAPDPKPQTNCKRGGRPVLCPEQKKFVGSLTKVAKQEAKLSAQLTKAKKTWREEASEASENAMMFVAAKIGEAFLFFEGKKKIPPPQLPAPKLEYKELQLPPNDSVAKLPIPGNAGKLFGVAVEGEKMLALNDKLMQKVESRRATDSAFATELDTRSLGLCGGFYDSCSPSQKMVVANETSAFVGEQYRYVNQAADLGIAGARFRFTLPGFK